MKRIVLWVMVLLLLFPVLSSCAKSEGDAKPITIVTTVFPEYDWTRQILGETIDQVNLILLTENGTDLHSYQPTVQDIATISECDILIFADATSDQWINDALAFSSNPDQTVIRLMDLLDETEKLEEQTQHHNVQHDEHAHHEHHHEYDEHVWLSLRLAPRFCQSITDALCQKLPQYADIYRENGNAYISQLQILDEDYQTVVENAPQRVVFFADRFPFSYLMHDYGITCYAAFPGCSSETEASFKTVVFLAEKVDEFKASHIIVLENSDTRLANTVAATTQEMRKKITVMDPLQSVSQKEIAGGMTYMSVMKKNLDALAEALGAK